LNFIQNKKNNSKFFKKNKSTILAFLLGICVTAVGGFFIYQFFNQESEIAKAANTTTVLEINDPLSGDRRIVFIPASLAKYEPAPIRIETNITPGVSGLSVRGDIDQKIVIKDDLAVEEGKTAYCIFRLKFVGSGGNGEDGWKTTTLLKPNSETLSFSYSDETLRTDYSNTEGCGVILPAGQQNQKYTDYDLETRIVRSDGLVLGRDDKFNMLFGAFARVRVGGANI
jgi:hypothetical protein